MVFIKHLILKFKLFNFFQKQPGTKYNKVTRDCDIDTSAVKVFQNQFKACSQDSDCSSPALACETSSKTCKALYGQVCLTKESCHGSIQCINLMCVCVSGNFLDLTIYKLVYLI